MVTKLPIGKKKPIFLVSQSKKSLNPQSYPQVLWIDP